MQRMEKESSLVQPDVGVLHLVRFVISDGLLQRPGPLAEHRRHDLHQLGGVALISALHHADLSAASPLSVTDVLSQQHRLRREQKRY